MSKRKSLTKKNSLISSKDTPVKRGEVDALKEELEAERKKAIDYQTRLIYLQADIENYRKRVQKDFDELTKYGSQRLIMKLLPIIDELEYAIEAGKNIKRSERLLEGIKIVLKKIYNVLNTEGVSPIDTIGKRFDPNRHEAVEKVAIQELEEGTIVEEIRKGYLFKERIIRASLVKVTIKPNKEAFNYEGDEK
ncbi:MAG: nucleotide exchange factor GrpE [Candidatus Hermodarchaeia archaeon]